MNKEDEDHPAEDTTMGGRTNAKRRGYQVSELAQHHHYSSNQKRVRHSYAPSRPIRDEDAEFYGRSRSSIEGPYDEYYGNGEAATVRQVKGWDCTECQTSNYPEESQCVVCGLFASSSTKGEPKKQRHEQAEEEDSDLDEFGRRRPPSVPPAPTWPPNFETHGSDYVLDNRSGMFYEAKSNFFYDPATKLYYSHDKQAYFRHRLSESGKSLFDKVDQSSSDTEESSNATSSVKTMDRQMMVPAISINLKTKALPKKAKKKKDEASANKSKAATPTVPEIRKKKEHEADLAKWSERQAEGKPTNQRDLSKILKTAKGEPICALCQRKFPTLDKLFYHERVSELHKTNLAKQAVAAPKATTTTTPPKAEQTRAYVDRAEQRRLLHGPESALVPGSSQTLVESSSPSTTNTDTKVDPKETLNESNIGNKMLQKLGWQQGKGLGRRTAESSQELQQDWERIERLAANGGRK